MSDLPRKIGPWTCLESDCVYENPWIKLTHEKVLTPAGTDGIYGKVHFKTRAVGMLALSEQQEIWLVGQYRYTLDAYSWEIPMGGCSDSEEPLEAAKRELQEETGITAEQWECLQTLHTSNSVTDEVGYVYLARGLSFGETAFEETEDITVKKLSAHEALQWVKEGKITDAISVAAIQHLALYYLD